MDRVVCAGGARGPSYLYDLNDERTVELVNIAEAARRSAEMARKFKEDKVAEAPAVLDPEYSELDIMPMVEAYRGETPVVVSMLMTSGSDPIMRTAQLLASGFDADILVITTESFITLVPENPVTGKIWQYGEATDVARNHDGINKGWVRELMSTLAVNRAGDIAQVMQDFQVHQAHAGWELEWKGAHATSTLAEDGEGVLKGRIPDQLRHFMNQPGMFQIVSSTAGLEPENFGLEDPEQVRAHLDCAAVKALYEIGGVPMALMLHAEPGTVRAAVIEESLSEMSVDPEKLRELFKGEDEL